MNNIPLGSLPLMSSLSGIVVSKAINYAVPHRREHLDQQRFAKRNPNVVHNKVTAGEVVKLKVLGVPD
ncbi:MAG TPA: hypothetical protein VGR73_22800 [Bryobacteraceae bacterium]|nr:hypothetical protein [Bryobacteraceae bacterium]